MHGALQGKRLLIRAVLVAALLAAFAVVFVTVRQFGADPQALGGLAGALAVITAVIYSWSTQLMLERQEDAILPFPYPFLDFSSRYGLLQLRVKNFGGSAAFNVKLTWSKPFLNKDGEPVWFSRAGDHDIRVLLPADSVSVIVGGANNFFHSGDTQDRTGTVTFQDRAGRHYSHEFVISAEQYRKSATYEFEEPKTHYQLQKIPEELERIRKALESIGTPGR